MSKLGRETLSCWDRALKLLARQDSSVRRLSGKLRQRGYSDSEIEETVDRLRDRGFVDDQRFGTRWAETKLRKGPLGRRRLQADLEARGLDGDLAWQIAAEAIPEDDLEAAREAAASWQRRRSGDTRALARYLDRLGFSSRSIATLVETHSDPPSSS